jgi:hypothetical protein
MKAYCGVEVLPHAFFDFSTSLEVSGQRHAPAALPPGKETPGTHWIGGWVGHRAVLDAMVKRKIPSSRRESNPKTPIFQPVYSGELLRFLTWFM